MLFLSSKKYRLSKCLQEYFSWVEADDILSKNTINKYREISKRILKIFGDIDIRKIDAQYITDFKQYLNRNNLSASRKNHYLVVLKNLLNFLKEQKLMKVYSAENIKKFKIPVKQVITLNREELERLINSLPEKTICQLRLKTAVICLISSGCRVSELLNLNISDVNLETGMAQVIAKGGKLHALIFNDLALRYIRKYLAMREKINELDALFVTSNTTVPKRWQVNDFERTLRNHGRKVGFNKSIHPHLIRASVSTLMFSESASLSTVQRFLGHSSPSITERYYLGNTSFSEVQRVHKEIMKFNVREGMDSS